MVLAGWCDVNAVYRERGAECYGGWEHRKVGAMWLWPIPPLQASVERLSICPVTCWRERGNGEAKKEEAVTIVWGDRQKKAGLSKNLPSNLPLHNRAIAHTYRALSSTETCCLRGWPSCFVLENSWKRRGKHLWDGTWSTWSRALCWSCLWDRPPQEEARLPRLKAGFWGCFLILMLHVVLKDGAK